MTYCYDILKSGYCIGSFAVNRAESILCGGECGCGGKCTGKQTYCHCSAAAKDLDAEKRCETAQYDDYEREKRIGLEVLL